MTTTPNATTPDQFVWPLPATHLPNAHLSWSGYRAWQATHLSDSPVSTATPDMPASPIWYLPISSTQRFIWPLPAALLPNGHLTWAEWTSRQAARTDGQQSTNARRARAA